MAAVERSPPSGARHEADQDWADDRSSQPTVGRDDGAAT